MLENNSASFKRPVTSTKKSKENAASTSKTIHTKSAVPLHKDSSIPKNRQMLRSPTVPCKPLAIKYRFLEGFAISCVAIGCFLTLSMLSYQPIKHHTQLASYIADNIGGKLGYYTARWLFMQIGIMAYIFPAALSYIGILTFKNRLLHWPTDYLVILCQCLGFTFIIIAGCGLNASFYFYHKLAYPGGLVGFYIDNYLSNLVGDIGICLLLGVLLLTGITLSTGISWINTIDQLIQWLIKSIWQLQTALFHLVKCFFRWIRAIFVHSDAHAFPKNSTVNRENKIKIDTQAVFPKVPIAMEKVVSTSLTSPPIKSMPLSLPFNRSVTSEYLLPSLDLLDLPDNNIESAYSEEALEVLSREVESQLKDFGIQVEIVGAYPGPVVTRFEMKLAPGVKVSRITALVTDLARSLAVVSVRIVEIIPGKSFVGLELPNPNRVMVRLRELLDSVAYKETPSSLVMALGKDIAGEAVIVDLGKMPHLLVAGTTGSGKSVGLNAMLLSILYKATPDQVRLIMIDPKMLELSIYEGIPHLLSPVVTDMQKAANALRWCIKEMDRRYHLMSLLGVRNLAGYNQKVEAAILAAKPLVNPLSSEKNAISPELLTILPYIVVLVDEFADLIMVVGKKVEELIARLAQKARAAGIHLILATQRPSVDVITGLIKANIPTRIAFQVSSGIDSRTILGQQGAEQLLGHGDMLYMAPGTGIPSRVHGAFVADEEVHKVVEALKQSGSADYQIMFSESEEADTEHARSEKDLEDEHSIYAQAVKLVIETRRASISNVQRRLKIGYNRAAGLLEQMEKEGIVSPMEVNGRREVLVSHED